MTNEILQAEREAETHVADMPPGPTRDLCRLAWECGYLRGVVSTRAAELATARERIAELEAAERGEAVPS